MHGERERQRERKSEKGCENSLWENQAALLSRIAFLLPKSVTYHSFPNKRILIILAFDLGSIKSEVKVMLITSPWSSINDMAVLKNSCKRSVEIDRRTCYCANSDQWLNILLGAFYDKYQPKIKAKWFELQITFGWVQRWVIGWWEFASWV